ncbi:hypothetical protein ACP70R_019718 [Stipagrostis hirtigluma subsp. patula]
MSSSIVARRAFAPASSRPRRCRRTPPVHHRRPPPPWLSPFIAADDLLQCLPSCAAGRTPFVLTRSTAGYAPLRGGPIAKTQATADHYGFCRDGGEIGFKLATCLFGALDL